MKDKKLFNCIQVKLHRNFYPGNDHLSQGYYLRRLALVKEFVQGYQGPGKVEIQDPYNAVEENYVILYVSAPTTITTEFIEGYYELLRSNTIESLIAGAMYQIAGFVERKR